MTDTITLTGIIATDPRVVTTEAGLDIASFRLASTHRRFDRAKDEWVDGDTNWYTVTAFRALAGNAGQSLHKGERVVVLGRLRVRSWESGDKSGTTVEVDADAIGHDLRWGRSAFVRSSSSAAAPTADTEAGVSAGASAGASAGGATHDGATHDGATGSAPGTPASSGDAWSTDGRPASDESPTTSSGVGDGGAPAAPPEADPPF